jgi:Cu(I)/Ag(I) efflux system periplasmic protein CusF
MKQLFTLIAALLTAAAALAAEPDTTVGEVRKVDLDAGKITLKHGEIKNLDMPSMTMVFVVKDKTQLDKLKPGDKVTFAAEKINGSYVVTQIVKAP